MQNIGIIAAGLLLAVTAAASAADIPAAAAACSGCHPASRSVDTPVPRPVGRDPAQIVAAMAEFRVGSRPATIMDRVAKGSSDEESSAIAACYGAQTD